jgi:hypothetical protein
MNKYLSLIFFVALNAGFGSCVLNNTVIQQIIQQSNCSRNLSVIQNFNYDRVRATKFNQQSGYKIKFYLFFKYQGLWYEVAGYHSLIRILSQFKCDQANFTLINNTMLEANFTGM